MRQVERNPECLCGVSVSTWLCLDPATALSAHTGDGLGLVRTEKSAIVFPRTCGDGSDTDARDARTVNVFYGTDYLGREATSVLGAVVLAIFGCVWRRNSSL